MKINFGLHESETACRTHSHMKGFALRLFETEAQENSEMAYLSLICLEIIVIVFKLLLVLLK